MEYLQHWFASKMDVESAVAHDLKKLDEAKAKLHEVEYKFAERSRKDAKEVAQFEEDTKSLRADYKKRCFPQIERINEIGVSEQFYKKILDSAAEALQYVSTVLDRETSQYYGYQAKNMLSLQLSFNALRQRLRSGDPYFREMKIFLETTGDQDAELKCWSDTLAHFSSRGLPQQDDLSIAALKLANVIHEVKTFETRKVQGEKTFLQRLQFNSMTDPLRARQPCEDEFGIELMKLVREGKWGAAVDVAERAAKKLRLLDYVVNPLDTEPSLARDEAIERGEIKRFDRTPPAAAYNEFRSVVAGYIVAKQFEDYSNAVLSLEQLRMASAPLSPGVELQQQTGDQ